MSDIATQPVSPETVVEYVVETHGADRTEVQATFDRLMSNDLWRSYYDFAEQFGFNSDTIGNDVAIHMGLVDPQWTVTQP